jgi:hypothetical protein
VFIKAAVACFHVEEWNLVPLRRVRSREATVRVTKDEYSIGLDNFQHFVQLP